MYGDCLESDWKQFRKKVPGWQEAYMEKLMKEYQAILCSEKKASEKFWTLEKRLYRDKRNPGVVIYNMRRSHVWDDILSLLQYGVITLADLGDFSQELQEYMARYMEKIEKE